MPSGNQANASVPTLLTISEVADRLRVDQKTVRRWISSNELAAFQLGRQWRVAEQDLKRFL
jgi:excisionase family DNA binding protein